MELNEYQARAASTALYPDRCGIGGLSYVALGMCGEAGEFANKVKKIIRGDFPLNASCNCDERTDALVAEMGDVLWYLAEAAANLGMDLEVIAQKNLEKLANRKAAGTVRGDGDNR